ncbi:hypothetical protein [Streptomyces sp. ACT015]|uniref:hypothetical protein n=1 Tax=Streptomyces sp. ACT015 TaxID=3134807 RepID=UPI003D1776DC
MSTSNQERSAREALAIVRWTEAGQTPSRAVSAEVERPGPHGRELDESNQETGVGNSYGGDGGGLPGLGPLSDFGSWESVAATVLRKTEDSAGFDPSSTSFNRCQWVAFENQFQTMPFLTDITSQSRDTSISSLSLLPAVSTVTQLVGGLVAPDTLADIINSIKKIGQLAVQNEGLQEKDTNMQLGVLTVVDGDLRLGLLRTTVRMEYRTGKGYQQLNQQITVSSLIGSLDFGMCVRNAEALLAWDGQDVNGWVNGTSSSAYPPNTSPAWGSTVTLVSAVWSNGRVTVAGWAPPGWVLKTTNDPTQGWFDIEGGRVHAGTDGWFTLETGRLINGQAAVMAFPTGDNTAPPSPESNLITPRPTITSAVWFDGTVTVAGWASPGWVLKTTNDPAQGWFDIEGGRVHAGTDGWFTLETERLINGQAAVMAFPTGDNTAPRSPQSNHVMPT